MSRYIDADELRAKMYHEAFETDTDEQKWDGGCWIRYKMFERNIESMPTADVAEVMTEEDATRWCKKRCYSLITNEFFEHLKAGVEVKRGRWEYKERREPLYDLIGVKTWGVAWQCSECGFIHTCIENHGRYLVCPSCGAKMDEVEE